MAILHPFVAAATLLGVFHPKPHDRPLVRGPELIAARPVLASAFVLVADRQFILLVFFRPLRGLGCIF
ncbi:hypothetical protein [Phyllobacterium sp. P5_D12]